VKFMPLAFQQLLSLVLGESDPLESLAHAVKMRHSTPNKRFSVGDRVRTRMYNEHTDIPRTSIRPFYNSSGEIVELEKIDNKPTDRIRIKIDGVLDGHTETCSEHDVMPLREVGDEVGYCCGYEGCNRVHVGKVVKHLWNDIRLKGSRFTMGYLITIDGEEGPLPGDNTLIRELNPKVQEIAKNEFRAELDKLSSKENPTKPESKEKARIPLKIEAIQLMIEDLDFYKRNGYLLWKNPTPQHVEYTTKFQELIDLRTKMIGEEVKTPKPA
jgi:hypothetical protein